MEQARIVFRFALVHRAPMQRITLLALCTVLLPSAHAVDWYVAPSGNDSASGRSPSSDAAGKDGPFASLERAREAIRQKRSEGDNGAQTVHVRAGTYRLSEAFKLEARDSGEQGAPVVWRAFEGEKPVISGAVSLEGWTPWRGEIWSAPLGPASKLKNGVRQVVLDGQRQTLARYPNADPSAPASGGWAFAEGKAWPMYADIPGEDKHSLEVSQTDLRSWAKPNGVEIMVFPRYNWWNSRDRVQAVESATRKISLASDCSYAIRKGDRYFFQNALEELDSPGEWYADSQEGMLYFWPPAGKQASAASVVVASSLVKFEPGTHDVVWRGFILEGCDGTAIALTDTQRCAVESNWIRSVVEWSGSAVGVSKGTANRVSHNTIEQVGNNGVSISGGDVPTLTPAGNVAEHNHIHHFGLLSKQGAGIALSGVGNKALHNEIHEGPRFGVMHSGNRNEIAWNHIYNVSLETEDTGAIYSGGRDWITPRGTAIYYNFIHDVPGFSMHDGKVVSPNFAWGVYLDDNSGGADVFGNIITRCGRGGIHAHGARDCVVMNNIFVGNKDWQVDFHGWTTTQNFWERHLPTMIKGYESVAEQPAWKGMRGMELHPAQAPTPDGLTMRGNLFSRNVVVSATEEVPVLSVLRVPFTHNYFDQNLYWAPGGNVRTGYQIAGPDEGPDLLTPLEPAGEALPKGWKWNTKPAGSPRAVAQRDALGTRLSVSCEATAESKGQMIISGPDIQLEPGATYRLRARVRASAAGKAGLGVHSFVNKVYFWLSPRADVDVTTEWSEKEWIFQVPAPGREGWHEQMKAFAPRVSWRVNGAALEVEGMHLHKVTPGTEWEAWQSKGVDAHSLVANPGWENADRFTLRPDSPAWKLGFERIPVELIGPQAPQK